MRRGVVVAAVFLPTALACGLSVTGVDPDPLGDDVDGGRVPPAVDAAPDAPGDTRDASVAADAENDAESAALDQARCLAVCTAGECRAGKCHVGGPSPSDVVTCPAGVPCVVTCANENDCVQGVDCGEATECTVQCTGRRTCRNAGVKCAGKRCDVTCSGDESCANGSPGVDCTASEHCGITCRGNQACANGVRCNAVSGDCTITCGETPNAAPNACRDKVECNAGTSCDVSCLGSDSCKNDRVLVRGRLSSTIVCSTGENCKAGVTMGGETASITCGGGNACSGGVRCEAEACEATCGGGSPRSFCCPNGSQCASTGCTSQQPCP